MGDSQIEYIPPFDLQTGRVVTYLKDFLYKKSHALVAQSPEPDVTCDRLVKMMMATHQAFILEMGGCDLAPVHEVLYVAAKLIVEFQHRNESTISELLADIYRCEGCFDRIYYGALYGPPAFQYKEFRSRRDYLKVLELFLLSSNECNMLYYNSGKFLRMPDVPLTNGKLPIAVARRVKPGGKNVSKLLRKYGTSTINRS